MSHSPGPWTEDFDRHVLSAERVPVAEVLGHEHIDADQRLIAAAPELLAVLHDVAALLPSAARLHPDVLFNLQTRVRAAIANAVP